MSISDEGYSNGADANGTTKGAADWGGSGGEAGSSDRFGRMRDGARRLYGRAFGQTREQLSDAMSQARESADDLVNLVTRKPFLAVGVAAFVGLTLGLLMSTGRTRLVFVERDD
ncbi:MAG TPA: hypothetical protein VG248_13220 [Caulobacteraceae bacterium]|jgi:ElaB/YqjD/DUF883 family membrane-anchored ribosome-binding protein|nr:hypothetical protein [Caulobacteraceae bacterium]